MINAGGAHMLQPLVLVVFFDNRYANCSVASQHDEPITRSVKLPCFRATVFFRYAFPAKIYVRIEI